MEIVSLALALLVTIPGIQSSDSSAEESLPGPKIGRPIILERPLPGRSKCQPKCGTNAVCKKNVNPEGKVEGLCVCPPETTGDPLDKCHHLEMRDDGRDFRSLLVYPTVNGEFVAYASLSKNYRLPQRGSIPGLVNFRVAPFNYPQTFIHTVRGAPSSGGIGYAVDTPQRTPIAVSKSSTLGDTPLSFAYNFYLLYH